MEFFLEILFTVLLSLLSAFLLSKLFSMASISDVEQESVLRSGKEFDAGRNFEGRLKNRELESEERVEFVREDARVDKFEGELDEEKFEMVYGGEKFVKEAREPDEICEDRQIKAKEEDIVKEIDAVDSEEKFTEERSDEKEGKDDESDLREVKESKLSSDDVLLEKKLIEEKPDKADVRVIDLEPAKEEQIYARAEEVEVEEFERQIETDFEGRDKNVAEDEKEGLCSDDDDWVGIERSEVEKLFGAAVSFVGSGDKENRLSNVGSEVQMQLFGLHKLAIEGPCHEMQPLTLNFSARTKWNSWKRLGNMSPEVAMEQYIAILSDRVPGWMEKNLSGERKEHSLEVGVSRTSPPDLSNFLHQPCSSENERKPEVFQPCAEKGDATEGPKYINKDKQ